MAGTRGRRGCSRRAFHLRPSRDHALPPKRVFAFKSPVGDAALLPESQNFPVARACNIGSPRRRYFIITRVSSTGNAIEFTRATYIAPISSILSNFVLFVLSFESFRLARTRTKKIRKIPPRRS